jgi:hypothetical protein
MPMPITPTARRIAHVHNCCGPALSGGLLGFDSEGRGGAWYSGRSQPSAEIVYPVGRGRVSVRDVQTWLNERERVALAELSARGIDFRPPSLAGLS